MSILNVNKISAVGGGSTITIAGIASVTNNISVGNSVTAGSFVGPIEGNVTGNLTGDVTGNTSGSSGSCTGNAATATLASGITTTASINTSGIVTATSFSGSGASLTGISSQDTLSFRNLIINGAMNVAQRATTSTSGSGYKTIDRWGWTAGGSGVDYITQAQVALTSADTGPWALGFRNCLKITNGDQSSSSGTANYAFVKYKVEAQDVAQSGWEYTSASSKITLSFWVKSSVAQNFYCNLKSDDGTAQNYPFETGALSANTWTKITKTIPGHANIQINNDNGEGLALSIRAFTGADWTDAGVSLNAWAAWASGTRVPVSAATWWDTDNATFAITGVQLEVGSTATTFEHRSYGDELIRCQRYFQAHMPKANEGHTFGTRFTTQAQGGFTYFTNFRANPSSTLKGLNIHVMSTGGNQEVTSHNNTIGGGADTRGAGMFALIVAGNLVQGEACLAHGKVVSSNIGLWLDAEL